jgi:uncharacterized membrane protein YraQ (UPF0718 family)
MDRLLPKRRWLAILVSGLLGAVFPVCECAIVPVIRRLVQKGLPVSCAVTYMLSAPIINPIVVVSTLSAFKGQNPIYMTGARLLIAYMVTVSVGLLIQRIANSRILKPGILPAAPVPAPMPEHDQAPHDHGHGHSHGKAPSRVVAAMRTAQKDFIDTAMYFTIGIMITALFNTQVDKAFVANIASSDAVGVPAMMLLAFVLSLCSTSDAFIAATLSMFSASAKLAFLVFGPMFDVKLLFMYSSVFRGGFVLRLVVGLFVAIALLCYAATRVFPPG